MSANAKTTNPSILVAAAAAAAASGDWQQLQSQQSLIVLNETHFCDSIMCRIFCFVDLQRRQKPCKFVVLGKYWLKIMLLCCGSPSCSSTSVFHQSYRHVNLHALTGTWFTGTYSGITNATNVFHRTVFLAAWMLKSFLPIMEVVFRVILPKTHCQWQPACHGVLLRAYTRILTLLWSYQIWVW